MNKKSVVHGVIVVTSMALAFLYFSMVVAARSFGDEGHDLSCCALAAYHLKELNEAERLEMMGQYITNHVKTAGRTVAHSSYQLLPQESKRTARARSVRIRPANAHAHWRKVRKKGVLTWPVDPAKFWISSYFGPRVLHGKKGFHNGIDMAASHGTPVVAAADGYVKEARYAPGYGNVILLVHPKGYQTRYAHLSRIRVKKGQRVRAGSLIGNVGATGKVTKSKWGKSASHLHFEVYSKGKRVNPFNYLG